MYNIEDYILKPKDERQSHLNLESACIERGGNSTTLKGLLAHLLDTTIPSGKKIHMCHACHNAACSNPSHLYWGTSSENKLDCDSNGGTSAWQRTVDKYGLEEALKRQRANGKKAGEANVGVPKSAEHRAKISESLRGRKRAPYKPREAA